MKSVLNYFIHYILLLQSMVPKMKLNKNFSLDCSRTWYMLICRSGSTSGFLPKVSIHKEEKWAEIIMPGYNYGDLDRMGANISKS